MSTLLFIDTGSLIFLIIAVLTGLSILAVPYFILYKIHKWLSRKGYRIIGLGLFIAFSVFPVYFMYTLYTSFYPPDSFYFSEFKEVTLRDAPKSARILKKDATYPDFHGDYCSASLMSVSVEDYSQLLENITNDSRFTKNKQGEIIGSSPLDKVMRNIKKEQIIHSFIRSSPTHYDYLYIGFLDDKRTIVVYICEA